ncbi:MAG: ammonium transporter, partial [Methylophilaceae bacterium]|nr:ammonium transporter [Methylophilaceae bacterium]
LKLVNYNQASKVNAVLNIEFFEVIWSYPSAASNECDRYVIWNYRENTWSIGSWARTTGVAAGVLFVWAFTLTQNRWKIDDVLGVWPLHGLCGAWGGVAAGIFGSKVLGGIGGVSLASQLLGTALGVAIAFTGGFVVYGLLKKTVGIRMEVEDEYMGADLAIHKITATPNMGGGDE